MRRRTGLRIVYLEDDLSAFELVRSLIADDASLSCELVHAFDESTYRAALTPATPDVIISDFNLPTIDGMSALALRGELCPTTPFIFLSGALGEATAIDMLKAGVTDFVLKDAMPRLIPSIRRCLTEAVEHRERLRAEASLRESEARFRRLAENAPDVIFRYRLDPRPACCEYINSAVERITGYRPEEFYADPQLPFKIVDPRDRDIIQTAIDRGVFSSGAAEIRWIARDGRTVVTDQRFVPLHNEAGRMIGFEGIARDVTEVKSEADRRRQLEAQLFQAQKMESIGTLAGGIAHDFNNILTGILGFTEIATHTLHPDDPARSSLDEVKKAGMRARDLVSQILTFSRQKEIRHVSIDLSRAVSEALNFLRASAPASIKIERRLRAGVIVADPTQVHQVVLNLCTNAIHAMQDRGGVLHVTVDSVMVDDALAASMPRVPPGPYVCLSVRDTGHGMDEETQRRVFDPFFTTKAPGEGTGLGLPVVQGIVATHRGGIRLESAVGTGSTFKVYFPAGQEQEAVANAVIPVATGRGEHVLVVDDEASVGTFTGVRLEQQNYRTLVLDDPRRALAAVVANPQAFDAVITDLTMPGMNGPDLIREVRAAGAAIPAIIITGNRAALAPGALDHLPGVVVLEKPFNGAEIALALREALDAKR